MKRTIIFSFALLASSIACAEYADMNVSACTEVVEQKEHVAMVLETQPEACELSIQVPMTSEKNEEMVESAAVVINL